MEMVELEQPGAGGIAPARNDRLAAVEFLMRFPVDPLTLTHRCNREENEAAQEGGLPRAFAKCVRVTMLKAEE